MRNTLILLCLMLAGSSAMVSGADHGDLTYQGLLTDISGEPVLDGIHAIVFTIWDDSIGGSQLWIQAKSVQTSAGRFDAHLTSPLGFLFEGGSPPDHPYFLQTQIVGDSPMTPRTRLGAVFSSILSHRMEGDVYTAPGVMQILPEGVHPKDSVPAIFFKAVDGESVFGVGSRSNSNVFLMLQISKSSCVKGTSFGIVDDHDFWVNNSCEGIFGIQFKAGMISDSAKTVMLLDWVRSAEDTLPDITLKTDDNENVIKVRSVLASLPAIVIRADSNESSFSADFYTEEGESIVNIHRYVCYANSLQTAVEVDWVRSAEDGVPEIILKSDADENLISVGSTIDTMPAIVIRADSTENSIWAEVPSIFAVPTETPIYIDYPFKLSVDAFRSALEINWNQPPVGGAPAIRHAADSIQSSIGLRFNDEAGSANLPEINMTATAELCSLSLRGPDPGAAGSTKTIMMKADDTEARIGINTDTPSSALYVNGDIVATGLITELSDGKLKTNIRDIEDALEIISQLRGVQFEWRQETSDISGLPEGEQMGVIAQEVEKILPQAVLTPEYGYKSVDYSRFTPILIEAIKEQQKQIDELQKMVNKLVSSTQTKVTVSNK